ncbi:MAG: ABC transporter permease [Syntrophales bacterium]|nr:ABC transporter permease [Syntrophales bacterium]
MIAAIERLGDASLNTTRSLRDTISFAMRVILRMFDRKTYNSAMKMVLIDQIYFTSVQILPLFITASVIFGSLLTGIVFKVIKDLGLVEYLGRILMGFVVTEMSPFITVMLIALRSSSAINTEVAVMKVNKELKTLEVFNIDVINYLFLPRIINGMISLILLSSLFSIVVLTSGLLFSRIILGMSLDAYTRVLLTSVDFSDIIILILKCATFGFFITLLPIRCGMTASNELTSIPVSVLNGMVKVFISIVIIEVLTLIARSI